LNEAKESSMDTVVPQIRLWLEPPKASASDVLGLGLVKEAASEPRVEPSRTTRPASSRMIRRGTLAGVRTRSGLISPLRGREVPERTEPTNSPLLSLRNSDWPRLRPGLELAS
jgi:hypothetical protein